MQRDYFNFQKQTLKKLFHNQAKFLRILSAIVIFFFAFICCTPIALINLSSPIFNLTQILLNKKCGDTGSHTDSGKNIPFKDIVKRNPPDLGGLTNYAPAQLKNAWIIVDVGRQMDIAPKGLAVALATSINETHLRNLSNVSVHPESANYPHDGDGADHDSLGLFQQRDSWGSVAERMDPWWSSHAFYSALLTKSPHYASKMVTIAESIEAVQVSMWSDVADWVREAHYVPFVKLAEFALKHLTGQDVADTAQVLNSGECDQGAGGPVRAQIVKLANEAAASKYHAPGCGDGLGRSQYAADLLKEHLVDTSCVNWCAAFVMWVWHEAGINRPQLFTTLWARGVPWHALHDQPQTGTWKPHTYGTHDGNPQPGDALVYGSPQPDGSDPDGGGGHIGIVVKVNGDGTIETVEGNINGGPGQVGTRHLDPAVDTNLYDYYGHPIVASAVSGYLSPPESGTAALNDLAKQA